MWLLILQRLDHIDLRSPARGRDCCCRAGDRGEGEHPWGSRASPRAPRQPLSRLRRSDGADRRISRSGRCRCPSRPLSRQSGSTGTDRTSGVVRATPAVLRITFGRNPPRAGRSTILRRSGAGGAAGHVPRRVLRVWIRAGETTDRSRCLRADAGIAARPYAGVDGRRMSTHRIDRDCPR